MEFPVIGGWDRGADDKGTLFQAASGIIEVLYHKNHTVEQISHAFLLIEVPSVEDTYHRLQNRGVTPEQEIITRPWGHRDFKLRDPNGITLGIFSKVSTNSALPGFDSTVET